MATQCGVAIFTVTCSFCLPEPKQVRRQTDLPNWPLLPSGVSGPGKVPQPEDCIPTEERLQKVLDGQRKLPAKLRE